MFNFVLNIDVLNHNYLSSLTGLMNTTGGIDDAEFQNKYFFTFNQDLSSLAVGTKTGYKLFTLSAVDTLDLYYTNDCDDVYIVERLFSSSLVALVTLSNTRKLKLCHFKKGTEICNYSYSHSILSVKLNRKRLIVCLEESLYIHNLYDMKVIHTIRDTPPNPYGLCALSPDGDNCFLAYPGSVTVGEVQIFDSMHLQSKIMIPAHDSTLAALQFSPKGNMLATASERGTVIRVFNVADGTKSFEFRRGVKRCVTISTLAFSLDSKFLAASSNTETVHIFKLEQVPDVVPTQPTEEAAGWIGYLSKAVTASATYLPSQVAEVFCQGRAFASVHLPTQGLRTVCALAVIQKALKLLVAASDGSLYVYNFDPNDGTCYLACTHQLYKEEDPNDKNPKTETVVNVNSDSDKETSKKIHTPGGSISSYAGILKGNEPGIMSESEKMNELIAATEVPPDDNFRLHYETEFPAM